MTNTLKTEKISGIYKIINNINDKYYVGSSNNIYKRWKYHKQDLNRGNHRSQYLQRAWNKYGEDNFTFVVTELIILDELLLQIEQEYLNIACQEKEKCYNSSFVAGKIEMNEITRNKISQSHKGKKLSKETKEKLRQCNLGKRLSEETKKKISDAHKGKVLSQPKGWHHTEESKKKISQKLKGKYVGILSHKFGTKHTEEWKKQWRERLKNHHPRLDKTVYRFQNEVTNEVFDGLQFDFRVKYNIPPGNLCHIIRGRRKSIQGWKLVVRPGFEPGTKL